MTGDFPPVTRGGLGQLSYPNSHYFPQDARDGVTGAVGGRLVDMIVRLKATEERLARIETTLDDINNGLLQIDDTLVKIEVKQIVDAVVKALTAPAPPPPSDQPNWGKIFQQTRPK